MCPFKLWFLIRKDSCLCPLDIKQPFASVVRHFFVKWYRAIVEDWKAYFASTDEKKVKPPPIPGPWPFTTAGELMDAEEFLDVWIKA